MARSRSGCTVRSFLPTMYQLGFDFQAVPPTLASNRSGLGTPWVAQTSFCSCSERSPQKYFVPSGRSQDRKSTRLNSSHSQISYAVFCLKKKKKKKSNTSRV